MIENLIEAAERLHALDELVVAEWWDVEGLGDALASLDLGEQHPDDVAEAAEVDDFLEQDHLPHLLRGDGSQHPLV